MDTSAYEWLIDYFDGKEYETYKEYEDAVTEFISDKVEELYKAETWACPADQTILPDILRQLGVTVKELETFAD